ncbi:MAG: hypothetical protein WD768_12860 [Phycisphaeraceae bacterium]
MQSILQQIAREHGTPCYVYFFDDVLARLSLLREAFGGRFKISYAVKSNPNLDLLRRLRNQADFLDISSEGELKRSLDAGWPASSLSFTGPGKRVAELKAAVEHSIGEVIVESLEEATQLDAAAGAAGRRQPILVRVAPKRVPRGFGVNMAGKPTQFGVDEEVVDTILPLILKLPHLDFRGLHIYSGSQSLNSESIAENYEIFIALFRHLCAAHNLSPHKLVFGSGLGIPYHEKDVPVDLQGIAARINPQLDALKSEPAFANAAFILELGRYLVGEAGIYLTQIIARKESRGSTICICDGGMNHHLGACGHFGSVIHRNYRMLRVTEPSPEAPVIAHELVGPLCTTIDTLGHGVKMPALNVGDIIAIHCSGAYGLSASPTRFISHPPPKEIMVQTRDGKKVISDVTANAC